MKLIDQIKKSTLLQKLFFLELVVLIFAGSIPTGNGSVWPFYVNKTGTTYGINLALVSEFSPGANHYGLNLSLITLQQEETSITGLNLNVLHFWELEKKENSYTLMGESELNGISIAVVQTGGYQKPYFIMNGVQLGFLNGVDDLNGFQFGIYNWDSTRGSFFVNLDF